MCKTVIAHYSSGVNDSPSVPVIQDRYSWMAPLEYEAEHWACGFFSAETRRGTVCGKNVIALCAGNCGTHSTFLTWAWHDIPSGCGLNLRRGKNSSVRLNDRSRLCFFNKYSRSSKNVSFKVVALRCR